jgi:hypothetical protein
VSVAKQHAHIGLGSRLVLCRNVKSFAEMPSELQVVARCNVEAVKGGKTGLVHFHISGHFRSEVRTELRV